jgi:hypothetical protein
MTKPRTPEEAQAAVDEATGQVTQQGGTILKEGRLSRTTGRARWRRHRVAGEVHQRHGDREVQAAGRVAPDGGEELS